MRAGGVRCFVSVWVLATALSGCDAAATSSAQGAAGGAEVAGGAGTAGTAGTAGAPTAEIPIGETVELVMSGGRVTSAELGIQGAVFAFADSHSAVGMTSNLTPPVDARVASACIAGTAAKVDTASDICVNMTFTPPATDCWSEFSGTGVAINLNQAPDAPAGEQSEPALPFDASALRGFAFDLDGDQVPSPSALRVIVEAEGEDSSFCNVSSVKLRAGSNVVLFSQLVHGCFRISDDPPNPSAETAQAKLLKISWHVVPNSSLPVPFDLCISNVRALLK